MEESREERGARRQKLWFVYSLAAGLAGALILNAVYAEPGRNLWWLFIVCPLAVYALLMLLRPLLDRG
jgi:hypothetical protein